MNRLVRAAAAALAGLLAFASGAAADGEPIRIGVIYDYTGPFADAGSMASAVGARIAIDLVNERGGVEGRMIEAVHADARSEADVAVREAARLFDRENVALVMGVYASEHCVPMAQMVNARKRFMWANGCISSAVFRGRGLEDVFRAQVHSDQVGGASCAFLNEVAKGRLGMAPDELGVAIIHVDGAYGAGVAAGNEASCRGYGMEVVLREGYPAKATDLSGLVARLRRARPDVILHTGITPDVTLFLRQARERGLRWRALIGHGAGYGRIDMLRDAIGEDSDLLFNTDTVAAQLLDPAALAPGLGGLAAEMVARYRAETGEEEASSFVSMGFNQTWVFLTDVLPRAIREHGGWDPEALRRAALATDIPEGGTIQGYGVGFYPPGHELAGQNERSWPVVMQYVDGVTEVVWPASVRTIDPVLPLPEGHAFAK